MPRPESEEPEDRERPDDTRAAEAFAHAAAEEEESPPRSRPKGPSVDPPGKESGTAAPPPPPDDGHEDVETEEERQAREEAEKARAEARTESPPAPGAEDDHRPGDRWARADDDDTTTSEPAPSKFDAHNQGPPVDAPGKETGAYVPPPRKDERDERGDWETPEEAQAREEAEKAQAKEDEADGTYPPRGPGASKLHSAPPPSSAQQDEQPADPLRPPGRAATTKGYTPPVDDGHEDVETEEERQAREEAEKARAEDDQDGPRIGWRGKGPPPGEEPDSDDPRQAPPPRGPRYEPSVEAPTRETGTAVPPPPEDERGDWETPEEAQARDEAEQAREEAEKAQAKEDEADGTYPPRGPAVGSAFATPRPGDGELGSALGGPSIDPPGRETGSYAPPPPEDERGDWETPEEAQAREEAQKARAEAREDRPDRTPSGDKRTGAKGRERSPDEQGDDSGEDSPAPPSSLGPGFLGAGSGLSPGSASEPDAPEGETEEDILTVSPGSATLEEAMQEAELETHALPADAQGGLSDTAEAILTESSFADDNLDLVQSSTTPAGGAAPDPDTQTDDNDEPEGG